MKKQVRAAALLAAAVISCTAPAQGDYSTLKYRDSGSAVLQLQQALKSLGYSVGTADGKYGAYTENAVRAFQKDHRLNVDGKAGNKTQTLLYSIAGGSSTAAAGTTKASSSSASSVFGGNYATIEYGDKGQRVKLLQKALNDLGYAKLTVDGKFGGGTMRAVKAFQSASRLTTDGKAGKKTLQHIEAQLSSGSIAKATATPAPTPTPAPTAAPVSTSSVPGRSLRSGDSGSDVTSVQKRLKELGWYTGSLDGKYGAGTAAAVKAFQSASKLTADGVAGSKTYSKLFSDSAAKAGSSSAAAAETASSSGSDTAGYLGAPSGSQIQLLHWFNDIKPSLKTGQRLLIYDPSTGISWTLKLLSLGRHADAEPLTAADTEWMVKSFGGVNTWSQHAVYVRLPNGTWTIGATHDMPHLNGSNKSNNFNGHLCVHFLRDMAEAEKNDPSYGVANQKTIREAWKKLTGQTISN